MILAILERLLGFEQRLIDRRFRRKAARVLKKHELTPRQMPYRDTWLREAYKDQLPIDKVAGD